MKKLNIAIILIIATSLVAGCNDKQQFANMINPWSDCADNLNQASKVAGFKFPLVLSNYNVRAMKGMIEISYPLDEFRNVIIRKSDKDLGGDISGVYNKYPINKEVRIKNGVPIQIRADENKIYVANLSAYTGYYSAYCKEGMTLQEIEGIYEILREAEDKN